MKEEKRSYIGGLLHGIGTLLTGMKITGREFFTPKVTRAVSREPCYTGNLSPFSRASRHAGRRKREQ